MIPGSTINGVSAKVGALYPAPNTPGNTLTGANNFFGSAAVPNTQDQFTARIDHSIHQKHRLFGRVSYSNVQRGAYDFFQDGGGWVNPGGGGVPLKFNARNATLDYTDTISPTLLLEFLYGYVQHFVNKFPAGYPLDLTTLNFPASFNQQIPLHALPAFHPSGFRAIAPASQDLINRGDNTHSWQASLTKCRARHTINWCGAFRFLPTG